MIGVLVLAAFGLTFNQLSVAGFVLALGLLVDDAIVVVENVARWLREGATRNAAAIGATSQIALAVIGCTACLMFAFLPLVALPEASGEFIRSLPVSVLGTVAGTAPFIGLFGTVVGIIKAFASIAANSGGGPEVVSAGIAEALNRQAMQLMAYVPLGYYWQPSAWKRGLTGVFQSPVTAFWKIGK